MLDPNKREMKIIEAYYNGVLIGKFIDMHTLRNKLGNLIFKVSYKFITINEKSNKDLFWNMIKNGCILSNNQKQR